MYWNVLRHFIVRIIQDPQCSGSVELHNGHVFCMCVVYVSIYCANYSPCRNEFAIATSDGQVFVRQFALDPEGMHLVRTLKGHQSEVTQVR